MIFVGDDKQICPEGVGINRDYVESLRQRLISDIPRNDTLEPDSSLFDQFQIRFRRSP